MSVDAKSLRIVYMGTPDFAVASLKALVEGGYNVVSVVTMPDKPAGRGLKLQQSAVKQYALSVGLPVLQPEKLKSEEFVEQFKALDADLGVVIAFRMLPEVIWSAPRLGTFNLHASLLPLYRGAAPINWAIINGECKSGVTTFMLNREIDKGDVLAQAEVEITEADNVGTLHDKLMTLGENLVVETVEIIAQGDYKAISQDEMINSGRLYSEAPKIFKADCLVDWSLDCERVHNKIRGLSPFPTAWSNGFSAQNEAGVAVKIFKTSVVLRAHSLECGSVLSDGKTYMHVACTYGFLSIDSLQMAGKKRMDVADFLRGTKSFDRFE